VRRPALVGRLGGITVPTRVVIGDADTACPRARGELLAGGLMQATVDVVHGAGHSVQLEMPEAVAAAIEAFMQTLPA
jgi:pimeloyl-ACP methyl ester carboxylesterase